MHHFIAFLVIALGGVTALALILRTAFRVYVYRYAPSIPPAAPNTCKIACIGDSITYGTLVRGRRRNCYPVQLGKLFGQKFSVRNFGANGRAMQKAADLPYWDHAYFELSSKFEPDVVLIMLGTNDSRKPNWRGLEPYLRDYREMLAHYSSLSSKPLIYALTPPTEFLVGNHETVRYDMIKEAADEMAEGIKKIAEELGIEVIDIHSATAPHPEHFSFDGVHANVKGARHIADTIHAAIHTKVCPLQQGAKVGN